VFFSGLACDKRRTGTSMPSPDRLCLRPKVPPSLVLLGSIPDHSSPRRRLLPYASSTIFFFLASTLALATPQLRHLSQSRAKACSPLHWRSPSLEHTTQRRVFLDADGGSVLLLLASPRMLLLSNL
jgi:hypothetical protein